MRLVGLFAGLVVASVAGAAPRSPLVPAGEACPGARADLFAYAGTYRSADVLADPGVAGRLDPLLGPERGHLQRNLAVSGSIDLIACHLVISGNAEHQGGSEGAIVAISLVDGSVAAAIQSAPAIRVYAEVGDYVGVPLAIRDWVAVAAGSFDSRFQPPAGTELIAPHAR